MNAILADLKFEIVNYFDELVQNVIAIAAVETIVVALTEDGIISGSTEDRVVVEEVRGERGTHDLLDRGRPEVVAGDGPLRVETGEQLVQAGGVEGAAVRRDGREQEQAGHRGRALHAADRTPGGAWRRLYSLRSTSMATRATTSGA